jgi:cellulose biosynthesis protein BcsQ
MKKMLLWNNKGGVGKTLLSFIISTEYAKAHPNSNILVIDTCPQADLSQILLGGTQDNSKNYLEIKQQKKTLAGYLAHRIGRSPYTPVLNESDYILQVAQYNANIPSNLYLICGDNGIEALGETLMSLANTNKPTLDTKKQTYYKEIYSYLIDMQQAFFNKYEGQACFIDTNPSFSIYTKMGLYASDTLIIPCFADLGSKLALQNVLSMVYNIENNGYMTHFKSTSEDYGLSLPLISHIVIGKSTQYNQTSAKAFKNIEEQIISFIHTHQKQFNGSVFANKPQDIITLVRDFNSIAPVMHDLGKMLANLSDMETLSNREPVKLNELDKYRGDIDGSIKHLLDKL